MTFRVTLSPSGRQFDVEADESILDAALRQDLPLPSGCRGGFCGSCKAQVLDGSIEQRKHSDKALSADEAARGFALLCCACARSDLALECKLVEAAAGIPVRKMACRIASIERLAPDVVAVRLQLPEGERLEYLAGQYVELTTKDGTRRSYSMASAPHAAANGIELHVRHMPGGRFTDALFGARQPALGVRDVLQLEGPLGSFFLREDSERPVVLLASGTGFAPLKALVEHARRNSGEAGEGKGDRKGLARPMTLYWGGRRPRDLYLGALAEQWAREIPGFRYVPVVSDALPEDGWSGRTGFVHRAVMQDFPDLSGHQVYACGVPAMVEAARRDFVAQCRLPEAEFFADAFTSSADAAKAA